MGMMEQAAAKLARKFGTVSEGKHKGCQIALGNDSSKKVEASVSFTQIIFLDGTEEKGRYEITKDFSTMAIFGIEETGLKMKLAFRDGEDCEFILETAKEDSFVTSLIKTFIGPKRTPEEKHMEKYRNIKIFMRSMMALLMPKSVADLEQYYKDNNIMEDIDAKLIAICKKNS